jgi:hypothetical protein
MSATNRGAERAANDLYMTPDSAFLPLIPYLRKLPAPFWDPAQGDGRLVRHLIREVGEAHGSDLVPLSDSDVLQDFLSFNPNRVGPVRDTIVTNPPYLLAQRFVEKALSISDNVVMLLRLNFLGSDKRHDFWVRNPPNALMVLSKRPSFTGGGKTDATDYAWFYWGRHISGIHFLK